MLLSSGESLSPDEIEAVRVRNAASMSSCRFPAFDQLLNFIAQDVRASIDDAPDSWLGKGILLPTIYTAIALAYTGSHLSMALRRLLITLCL